MNKKINKSIVILFLNKCLKILTTMIMLREKQDTRNLKELYNGKTSRKFKKILLNKSKKFLQCNKKIILRKFN